MTEKGGFLDSRSVFWPDLGDKYTVSDRVGSVLDHHTNFPI